jgi:hypothetical protein
MGRVIDINQLRCPNPKKRQLGRAPAQLFAG